MLYVLQSLVICFPVVDKQFTQFYWDILNNRYKLRKSKNLTTKSGVKINVSKLDHTTHSGPCSFMIYSKSAYSNRLINAAGRLFCLKNTNSTTIHSTPMNKLANNQFPMTTTPTTTATKQFCFPFKDSTGQLQKSLHRDESIRSSFYQKINETPDQVTNVETNCDQSMNLTPIVTFTDSSDEKLIKSKDVKFSSYSKVDVHNDMEKLLTDDINYMNRHKTLRRNHSRYRSLRRRQMENLTRRAEWFLQPTTLPEIRFTPETFKNSTETSSMFNNNNNNMPHHNHNNHTQTTTTMSTMSLLEAQQQHQRQQHQITDNLFQHTNRLQLMNPRILFTYSTNDLHHTDYNETIGLPSETLSATEPISPNNLCTTMTPNYGHSYTSLLNVPSSCNQYYVIKQPTVNMTTTHTSTTTTTDNAFLSSNLSQAETNISTNSLMMMYYRMPKHSLPYDYSDMNRQTKWNRTERLQSSSYDNFYSITYPSHQLTVQPYANVVRDSIEHRSRDANNSNNNNNSSHNDHDITPASVSISNTLDTNTTTLSLSTTTQNEVYDRGNALSSNSCFEGRISKSDIRCSDWSIDQPIRNELLSRRRSTTALMTMTTLEPK
ncbi:unnamed protein product [Schistosoma turkestanicum]|nr:unnamed protein product [Schistosoma turkestanicum]